MIGTHVVTVAPPDGGTAEDITCLIDTVSIVHGRTDPGAQPDASAATLDLSFPSDEVAFPTPIDIGSLVTVTTTVGATTSTRFVGRVTDMSIGWDEQGPDTPDAVVAQLIAVGPLADLGRAVVGGTTYPAELDGPRVARILTDAGVTAGVVDPGTVQILARDIDPKSGLGVAQEVATSAGGVLWQTRAGVVSYADADHRRGATPALTLDSCDVLVSPTWLRDTAGLVNGVAITYGVASGGGDRPVYTATRAESAARYGRREVTAATVLAALADAEAMGNLILTRNAFPAWLLTDLPVDVDGLDEPDTLALLALDMHDLLGLTGMPAVSTLPTTTSLWVEGWTETLAYGVHELGFKVSGFCRTVPPPRWDDVPSALTWDTVPAALTWDAAVCMGPPVSEGRWTDVPASLQWDLVPPITTWDTWEG